MARKSGGRRITVESYFANPEDRALADRLMAALHLDPAVVEELTITQNRVVARVLDRFPATGASHSRDVVYDLPKVAHDADSD